MTNKKVSELQAVQAWTQLLAPHFQIEKEVEGIHWTGRKMRIDMVLHPLFEWHGGGHQPIGFEIKKPDTNDAKLVGQAVDYANTQWNSRIIRKPVVMFIAVFAPKYHNPEMPCETHGHLLTEQLLGRLGVINFDLKDKTGLELRVSGEKMWSPSKGVRALNWSAQRKIGSR